ncbi:GAF domain-containing protein [Sphingomonas hankyongi]|uniref:GAF domain-containing protein n=1 Tax=Sphingomonas hankyongi TaxID=2908209 RepID=A0ABT0RZ30_9SPHN|nr:GAF domain-containing protein [Sphingomonas hankyongi]MCL6728646.1 GAF domain-containing protein [Sphingomonas hankyongi]
METIHDMRLDQTTDSVAAEMPGIQSGAYLLELSLDWIVLRASENAHHLLGESHVTLVDEPLGRFVQAEPLHDLRNLFSRLSGTTGIARAYRVRLTNDPDLFDIAFHLAHGRVLLEAVPSARQGVGEAFGTVGGLIAGLEGTSGDALLEGGARRMRALTGYDRVTLTLGGERIESSRGALQMGSHDIDGLPTIVSDASAGSVGVFPRDAEESSAEEALLRGLTQDQAKRLADSGVRAVLRVPFTCDGESGEFVCESRSPRPVNFEVHAAAELLAQMFAMTLRIDALNNG